MLACENIVETELRSRLRDTFGVTLPQFDTLAELEHAGRPLTMSELSQELMVSNGNITGVVDRLVRDGYARRVASQTDRRVQYIELTETGYSRFAEMARLHEQWVTQLLAGIGSRDMETLTRLLKKMQDAIDAAAPG
ncbi:MAG: MarR family transcriptional regulator [Gammaproteobacteria bacterium]|nr:MarR family transcriptional regulator [Gammaproteobacteria bacterium]